MGSKASTSLKYRCKGKTKKAKCKACNNHSCPQYWDRLLSSRRINLGMDRGARKDFITYGHMIEHFGEFEGKVVYSPPTGERLDQSEWQITVL